MKIGYLLKKVLIVISCFAMMVTIITVTPSEVHAKVDERGFDLDTWYYIRNYETDNYLTVSGESNFSPVTAEPFNGSPYQKWRLVYCGNGK